MDGKPDSLIGRTKTTHPDDLSSSELLAPLPPSHLQRGAGWSWRLERSLSFSCRGSVGTSAHPLKITIGGLSEWQWRDGLAKLGRGGEAQWDRPSIEADRSVSQMATGGLPCMNLGYQILAALLLRQTQDHSLVM